ncbi:MAG TPA: hypothetical protein VIG51_07280 [Candidatus Baltobacteraceae bacterium]|jgi:hypothetical protein
MTSGSMLGGVISWLTNRGASREEKRRAGSFHVWYHPEADGKAAVPGVGMEVTHRGFAFAIPAAIAAQEFNVTMGLRNQKIPVRVRVSSYDRIQQQGKLWHRYAVEFLGIAADHWDLVVRYVNDAPEPIERKDEPERVDDAYRLLPLAIQEKIIAVLVSQHKLDAPRPGQIPLMKLYYSGVHKQAGGPPMHRFKVHSRITINDEVVPYDTPFLIGDDGTVKPG